MGKSSSQTIGYEYSLGMHVGFCHGPIDRITRIRFDKRTAWCGNNFGGRIDVSARDLFGGKKREGGVAGAIDFEPGDLTQTPNDYLTTQLTDGPLPAFRNIAALVFRKFYFGMSPYLKPLEIRASRIFTRTDGADQWYEDRAQIGPCGGTYLIDGGVTAESVSTVRALDHAGNYNGVWVAIAATSGDGLYYSDDDGETWIDTGIDISGTQKICAVDKVTNELFACNQSTIRYTTDGINYTTVGMPTTIVQSFAAHGGVWVASSNGTGLVYYSTSAGASWSVASSPGVFNGLRSIVVQNDTFFAVESSGANILRASVADPSVWERVKPPAYTNAITTIGAINGRVFARFIGSPHLIVTNDNGETWAPVPLNSFLSFSGGSASFYRIFGSDFILCGDYDDAVSGQRSIAATTDGITWERIGLWSANSQYGMGNNTQLILSTGTVSGGLRRITFRDPEVGCFVRSCDMNPAHIIREVLTDKAWGMGYPEADIDDASFTAAADQLYSEQMGISILWDRQQSIQDFLDLIVEHIDATIYVSRDTGKFVLKLIRNDYTVGSLLTLGTDEVQGVENFAAPAQGDLISSVSAIYWDSVTGEQASVTVHDQALAVQQGAVVGTTSQYPGFTNRRIAAQVAYRDLRALSVPLRSCTVYANRVASALNPGDVFKLDWPDISAEPIIMRVTGIALGDGRTNRVRITCVEDVFSLGEAPIAQDVPSKWQDPAGRPTAPDARLVFEAPYYAIARQEGETVANQFLAAQPTAGWLMSTAKRPGSAINLDVFVDPGTGYVEEYVSDFSPWAVLTAEAGPADTVLAVGSVADLADAVVGQLALLGAELVRIDVVTDSAITVGRGCLDTVPTTHAIGTNLVLWQDYADIGPTVYDEGEAIDVKLLPNSGGAQVAIDLVTADTLTFDQRAYRPYPPGLFQINGESYPSSLVVADLTASNAISVSWAHRDRLQQTGGTVADTTAANIGPEAGTTYSVELFDVVNNTVLYSSAGLTASPADYSLTGFTGENVRFRLSSVRSALDSFTRHEWTAAVNQQPGDAYWSNVQLLLHLDGEPLSYVFTDSSSAGRVIQSSNEFIRLSTPPKFGPTACRFTSGGRLYGSIPAIGTQDFTIELWVQHDTSSGGGDNAARVVQIGSNSVNGGLFLTRHMTTSNPIKFAAYTYSGGAYNLIVNSAAGFNANIWGHVALQRKAGDWGIYIDGVLDDSQVGIVSGNDITQTALHIGSNQSNSDGFRGFMDDIRITIGAARYSGNFTPPTLPYPNFTL